MSVNSLYIRLAKTVLGCGIGFIMLSASIAYPMTCSELFKDRETGPIQKTLQEHGYQSLVHKTNLDRIVHILKHGALSPASERLEGRESLGDSSRPDAVFFDLTKQAQPDSIEKANDGGRYNIGGATAVSIMRKDFWVPQQFPGAEYIFWGGLKRVVMEFTLSPLDAGIEYHISSLGWNYGVRLKSDFVYQPSSNNLKNETIFSRFQEWRRPSGNDSRLREFLGRRLLPGEVVYNAAVSLRFLRAIYVVEIYRDELIESLKQEGIFAINSIPIEELIRPIKITTKYAVTQDGDVVLY